MKISWQSEINNQH